LFGGFDTFFLDLHIFLFSATFFTFSSLLLLEIRARNENDEQQRREGEEGRREQKYMEI
jgi:hypothetical protein